jgi:hypothetical protein
MQAPPRLERIHCQGRGAGPPCRNAHETFHKLRVQDPGRARATGTMLRSRQAREGILRCDLAQRPRVPPLDVSRYAAAVILGLRGGPLVSLLLQAFPAAAPCFLGAARFAAASHGSRRLPESRLLVESLLVLPVPAARPERVRGRRLPVHHLLGEFPAAARCLAAPVGVLKPVRRLPIPCRARQ